MAKKNALLASIFESMGKSVDTITPEPGQRLRLSGRRLSMPLPAQPVEVDAVSGSSMMFRMSCFNEIGGMDERYFLHVEDIDLCLRFNKAGGEIYFNPNVEVTHFKSSSRVNSLRVEARKNASMIRYFRAHFSDPYPAAFLWLVAGAMWLSFGLLAIRRITAFAGS